MPTASAIAALPDSLAREFGVEDTRGLLVKLNAHYRRCGVQPLSEESCPTTRAGLATLVDLYRRATGTGLPSARKLAEAGRRIATRREQRRRPLPPPQDAPAGYSGLRTAQLPGSLAREFGVLDTRALVARLNELYASRGEPPLPQGSYPTNSQALRRLVTLCRDEFRTGPGRP